MRVFGHKSKSEQTASAPLVDGFHDADLVRSARKDLQQALRFVGQDLDDDEELVNFFKLPSKNGTELCYLFLTSDRIRISQISKKKEKFCLPIEHILGIRMQPAGWVRLAYRADDTADDTEIENLTMFLAGGRPEVLTFYAQLAVAWSNRTGRQWSTSRFLDAKIVPPLEIM